MSNNTKNYSSTYLYNKFPYEEKIFKFIMSGEQIPVMDDKFEDVKFEFKKRQVHPNLIKILCSKNVILLRNKDGQPLNPQFKVFCSKDIKSKSNDMKVFVDVTDLIGIDSASGKYKCKNIDTLISYIVNAMVSLIYHKAPQQVITITTIDFMMDAFSALMTYVIDYLTKISAMPSTKSKCQYLACMYFIKNILGENFNEGYRNMAGKITKLSEREQSLIIANTDEDDFINIKYFVNMLADAIKTPSLKVDNVVDKWMFLFGVRTPFAMEYFPALSAMLTDAYVGAYINNQKTIEKVVGNTLVGYTKYILEKGGSLV